MNAALWTIQAVLAATFAASGAFKLTQSKERMIATGQTGVAPFPLPVIRVVAALELLAAAGLLLPQATGVAPALTVVAAAGVGLIMIGAAGSHWSLREYKQVFGINLVLLGLAVFVVVGRAADLT
jgi:uncharacterized membrane protein YphA (DoxX/SURF4 family)